MTILTFDVECIGCEDETVIAEIAASIKPAGNLKNPETIDKWIADEKPAALAEAVKKTCFDGALGRIVCIGFAINDAAPMTAYGNHEPDVINAFFDCVRVAATQHFKTGSTRNPPIFVGHNITGFDLRFLWQRAVVLGIKPPSVIPFKAKPWDSSIADTMLMWNSERDKRISLDRLCKALGVPTSKGELDGSKVWDYVRAGRIDEVADYCRKDVEATRACYYRMMFSEPESMANAA